MDKPLSQLLAEVEPEVRHIQTGEVDTSFANGGFVTVNLQRQMVDRASYDKLKAIAVELARALEGVRAGYHANLQEPINYAKHGLTTARKMLEGEDA